MQDLKGKSIDQLEKIADSQREGLAATNTEIAKLKKKPSLDEKKKKYLNKYFKRIYTASEAASTQIFYYYIHTVNENGNIIADMFTTDLMNQISFTRYSHIFGNHILIETDKDEYFQAFQEIEIELQNIDPSTRDK